MTYWQNTGVRETVDHTGRYTVGPNTHTRNLDVMIINFNETSIDSRKFYNKISPFTTNKYLKKGVFWNGNNENYCLWDTLWTYPET